MNLNNKLWKRITAVAVTVATLITGLSPGAFSQEIVISDASITAEAADNNVSFEGPHYLRDIINQTNGAVDCDPEVRTHLANIKPQFISNNYKVLYSTNLNTNYIFVYNNDDINLGTLLSSDRGKKWSEMFSKYNSALSNISGLKNKYIAFALCTDDQLWPDTHKNDSAFTSGEVNKITYYKTANSFGITYAIYNMAFTISMLHEVSHCYSYKDYHKMVFNSEEEVLVTLRLICALHCMDNERKKETEPNILLDYDPEKWEGSEVMTIDKSTTDFNRYFKSDISEYWDWINNGDEKQYILVSATQYIASKSNKDKDNRQPLSRPGAVFNLLTDKPVYYAKDENPNNSENWIERNTINNNWKSIDTVEWQKLIALCIVDPTKTTCTDSTERYISYLKACTERIDYNWNGTNYYANVTPRVKRWIETQCSQNSDGTYYTTGNLIQAYNMLDFLCNSDDISNKNIYKPIYAYAQSEKGKYAYEDLFHFYHSLLVDQYISKKDLWKKNLPVTCHRYTAYLSPSWGCIPGEQTVRDYLCLEDENIKFSDYLKTPLIKTQPVNFDGKIGERVELTVGATTIAGTDKGLSYQWKKRKNATTVWENSNASSANKATLSYEMKAFHDGYEYQCFVYSENGTFVASEIVSIKVVPNISTQPISVTVPSGQQVKFTVEATGAGTLTYQWQSRKNSDSDWAVSNAGTSAQTATLKFTAKSNYSGYQYRCVVTSSNGTQAISNPVTFTCS